LSFVFFEIGKWFDDLIDKRGYESSLGDYKEKCINVLYFVRIRIRTSLSTYKLAQEHKEAALVKLNQAGIDVEKVTATISPLAEKLITKDASDE